MNYGDAFKHSMEEGGWDLSKVDMKQLAESKATFVFGQMNEPPGARARVALSGLTIAEYYRDGDGQGKGRDILFFVDNIFRFTQEGSPPHEMVQSVRFRQYMCLQMTLPIRLLPQRLRTLTRQRY